MSCLSNYALFTVFELPFTNLRTFKHTTNTLATSSHHTHYLQNAGHHKDEGAVVDGLNGGLDFGGCRSAGITRALRPILRHKPKIELYNYA